jgi:hypothetical protein
MESFNPWVLLAVIAGPVLAGGMMYLAMVVVWGIANLFNKEKDQ